MLEPRLLPLALLLACGGPAPEGWAPAEATGGPVVIFDPVATPLPEIPLPNDAATRLDPSSPTGRRLNVSMRALTAYERETREKFDRLDGFATYAPISVSFDAPLDVVALRARHVDDDDFRNDAVFLLNVDPDCARFGEEIALDMGSGRFPATMYTRAGVDEDALAPGGYRVDTHDHLLFPFDEHALANNWLFEETNEDLDGDGELDPAEDVDHDGVLDVANLDDPHACDGTRPGTTAHDVCIADHLLSFYERQTNTLILHPLWPMEEHCTHAVVLTKRLVGEDGRPVASPFPAVNHRDQTAALQPATALLSTYGLTLDDVAFAWTFTTGTVTADLKALRAGLYGAGPFAALAEAFPPTGLHLWTRGELAAVLGRTLDPDVADDTFLSGACSAAALADFTNDNPVAAEGAPNMCAVQADFASIGALFGGTFAAPDFLVDKEDEAIGRYDGTSDELFDVDLLTGEATYGTTDVTFHCALPIEDPTVSCSPGNPEGTPFCKPFPVVTYSHGYGGSRAEVILHMGRHTAMGVAACGLDSYGHGLNRLLEDPLGKAGLALIQPRMDRLGAGELLPLVFLGRDRDLNNDGLPDPGMDQWTADIFHTRDMVRQSVVEVMQWVRLLRHMDGVTRDADGRLLGDVDGDGTVDLGGPHNGVQHWGISLGGMIAGVLAGAEPGIDAISPNAGGAGLTEVSVRSSQPGVPEAVILPMLGQLVAACLPTDGHDHAVAVGAASGDDCWAGEGVSSPSLQGGTLRVALINQDEAKSRILEVGAIEGVQPGDTFTVTNLTNGESRSGVIGERGWIRLGVAADALDPLERRRALGWGAEPGVFDITDPALVADLLEVTVTRGGASVGRLDTFQHDVVFQGSRYAAGKPLAALQEGYGYARNSPDVRRLVGFAQHGVAPGDPGVWTQHAFLWPHDVSSYDPFDDGEPTRLLVMPTIGDDNVPASTGIAMARAAGLLGSWKKDPTLPPEQGWRALYTPDPRYDENVDRWLIRNRVIEGDGRLQRWAGHDFNPEVLFDPDDQGDGATRFSCGPSDWSAVSGESGCPEAYRTYDPSEPENFFDVPNPPPGKALRLDQPRGNGFVDAFRIPMLRPVGQHGIYNAQSFRVFDNDAFAVDFTARFLASLGRDTSHEPGCDCSASDVAHFAIDGDPAWPGTDGVQCADVDGARPYVMKVCSPACAAGWGLRTPALAECATD